VCLYGFVCVCGEVDHIKVIVLTTVMPCLSGAYAIVGVVTLVVYRVLMGVRLPHGSAVGEAREKGQSDGHALAPIFFTVNRARFTTHRARAA